MNISLENVGKRFRYDWIFRSIQQEIQTGNAYAVTGPNGSGKSTLLKILAGFLTPSEGTVTFTAGHKQIDADAVYKHISYTAPYIELIEEFTLQESIVFHNRFKPFLEKMPLAEMLDIIALPKAADKPLKYFSSGMKQRLKLALAVCSDSSILLLDEPTTNLDREGTQWYLELMERFANQRLVVVASNVEKDYSFCKHFLHIPDYKKRSP